MITYNPISHQMHYLCASTSQMDAHADTPPVLIWDLMRWFIISSHQIPQKSKSIGGIFFGGIEDKSCVSEKCVQIYRPIGGIFFVEMRAIQSHISQKCVWFRAFYKSCAKSCELNACMTTHSHPPAESVSDNVCRAVRWCLRFKFVLRWLCVLCVCICVYRWVSYTHFKTL